MLYAPLPGAVRYDLVVLMAGDPELANIMVPTQPPPPDDLAPATAAQIKAMLQAMVGDPLIHILTMLEKLDNKTERLSHRVDGHDLDFREIKTEVKALKAWSHEPYDFTELVRRVEALERGPSNGSASG